MNASKPRASFPPSGPRPKRATQSFEPSAPIREMIALEMQRRQQADPGASKTGLFEDCLATALGGQYPQQAARFHLARRVRAEEQAAQPRGAL